MTMTMAARTTFGLIIAFLLTGGGAASWGWQHWVTGTWHEDEMAVEVLPSESSTERWERLKASFAETQGERVVTHLSWRGWDHRIKAGRFLLLPTESVEESAKRLVTGDREVVKLVVPSGRDLGPIAGSIAQRIFADSTEVATRLQHDSVMWRVLPNTYEVWWETDADKLLDRLLREHQTWWTLDRQASAQALGLSIREATVLASIVQAETADLSEAPMVAGLYLNRLKKGMALQADPTLIFALNDPSIRRVLDVHKNVSSPYNTYMNKGLPPGPIRYVDPRYILSVLKPAQHNHLYMCAEPEATGKHRFARTYREHLRNARAYQRWLNQQRIFR